MIYNSITYKSDITKIANMPIFETLKDKSIMITGACGLIGSFLVDVLMERNKLFNDNITIIAYDFKEELVMNRFPNYIGNSKFKYICQDVNLPLNYNEPVNYIMHLASNAHPQLFKTDPVGTIRSNIIGLNNLLEFAKNNGICRVLYTSTGEVYGVANSSITEFTEDYSGYVDPTSSRSCYPASKRAAETLCVSYSEQYGIDVIIARPCHVYGPTMTKNDSRVYAQFIQNVLNDEDIVLKSKGEQVRSYCYVADCVSALLYILVNGKDKNAYNIAYKNSITSIYNMALVIAKLGNKEVKFDIKENLVNNPMQCGVLNSSKLESLGWYGQYDLESGYRNTINILKEIN